MQTNSGDKSPHSKASRGPVLSFIERNQKHTQENRNEQSINYIFDIAAAPC